MTFYERLAALMEERKITSYRITLDTKIPNSQISYWKRGKSQPTMENLIKLAEYFNVSLDYLVGRTDDPVKPDELDKTSNQEESS